MEFGAAGQISPNFFDPRVSGDLSNLHSLGLSNMDWEGLEGFNAASNQQQEAVLPPPYGAFPIPAQAMEGYPHGHGGDFRYGAIGAAGGMGDTVIGGGAQRMAGSRPDTDLDSLLAVAQSSTRAARNGREQQRAQKISDVIDKLKTMLDKAEFPRSDSASKLHVLTNCEDYLRSLQQRTRLLEMEAKLRSAASGNGPPVGSNSPRCSPTADINDSSTRGSNSVDWAKSVSRRSRSSNLRRREEQTTTDNILETTNNGSGDSNSKVCAFFDEEKNGKTNKSRRGVGGGGAAGLYAGLLRPVSSSPSSAAESAGCSSMEEDTGSTDSGGGGEISATTTESSSQSFTTDSSSRGCTTDASRGFTTDSGYGDSADSGDTGSGDTGSADGGSSESDEGASSSRMRVVNYFDIFRLSNVPMAIASKDGLLVDVNDAMRGFGRIDQDTVKTLTVSSLVAPESSKALEDAMSKMLTLTKAPQEQSGPSPPQTGVSEPFLANACIGHRPTLLTVSLVYDERGEASAFHVALIPRSQAPADGIGLSEGCSRRSPEYSGEAPGSCVRKTISSNSLEDESTIGPSYELGKRNVRCWEASRLAKSQKTAGTFAT